MRIKALVTCGFLLTLACSAVAQQEEDLRVISGWRTHNIRWVELPQSGSMLLRRLNAFAFRDLDRRERDAALLRTAADWRQRQSYVRRTLDEILGPWPEKTPLKARVTEVIRREHFRIEKLVYESQPGFYVTATLYVPERVTDPRPGILYIPGHSLIGFRADHYQNVCLNLVHKGAVVLAYDPIGQGERLQNIDSETGDPFVTRREVSHYKIHSYPGNQCYLAGVSIARYFIWDGIRGIDYLVSRPEVDPARIGVTGNSGGGNLSVYIGAIDDRVAVAVPSCYVTSYRRMLSINGVQDAEQNILHGLARGIDHADWLLARAPKPTLLLTTTRDFFPIQGARETAAEVRRAYAALGAPENFSRAEDDHEHGYTRKNNEASYAFLMKHLRMPGNPAEHEYPLSQPEQLQVTSTGQVATALKSETVFSLNRRETQRLLERLTTARRNPAHLVNVAEQARRLAGYEVPTLPDDAVFRGGYQREGYRIEKYALLGGDNEVVPLILGLPPEGGKRPAVIYVHPDGKAGCVAAGGPVEALVRRGYLVAAPDLAGTGETALEIGRQNDHNAAFYTGLLTSHSAIGLQVTDLARVIAWLQSRKDVQPANIGVVAAGSLGPAAIHAAALEPDIRWLALERTPVSYASMVMEKLYVFPTSCMVAGALTAYDLPDLLASIAPRKIAIVHPVDEKVAALSETDLLKVLQYPLGAYTSRNSRDQVKLVFSATEGRITDIADWCSTPSSR